MNETEKNETPVTNDAITSEIGAPAEQRIVESAEVGEHVESQDPPSPISYKEMKALRKARYEDIMDNPRFKNAYLLKNVKTNQMVEIRASSSFHACNIIGWKPNKVKLLNVRPIEDKKTVPETVGSSSTPITPA